MMRVNGWRFLHGGKGGISGITGIFRGKIPGSGSWSIRKAGLETGFTGEGGENIRDGDLDLGRVAIDG